MKVRGGSTACEGNTPVGFGVYPSNQGPFDGIDNRTN